MEMLVYIIYSLIFFSFRKLRNIGKERFFPQFQEIFLYIPWITPSIKV